MSESIIEQSTAKKNNKENLAYINKYGELVDKVYKIGGFPLTILVLSVLIIIIVITSPFLNIPKDILPFLFVFATLLSISAVVLYIFIFKSKQFLTKSALAEYNSMLKDLFKKYLDTKDNISVPDFKEILNLLTWAMQNSVLPTSIEKKDT